MDYGVNLSFAGALEDSELYVKFHADCWDNVLSLLFQWVCACKGTHFLIFTILNSYKFEVDSRKSKGNHYYSDCSAISFEISILKHYIKKPLSKPLSFELFQSVVR